jgi:hypothetical protein
VDINFRYSVVRSGAAIDGLGGAPELLIGLVVYIASNIPTPAESFPLAVISADDPEAAYEFMNGYHDEGN